MQSRYASGILVVVLLIASSAATLAQTDPQTGDWSALSGYSGREIAVKPEKGKTVFGILRSADDSGLEVVNADGQVKSFTKAEVEKVWLARLKGSRNTGKGAAIGGGVGAGIGLATLLGSRDDGDGQAAVAVPVLAIMGAGIGAVAGFFSRSKNKKEELIYKR
ncbi:MAG: hypothetical protein J5I65_11180 [Aridibacter famidurans]|nr:hypothetical protein [Aridibacter famidurans]